MELPLRLLALLVLLVPSTTEPAAGTSMTFMSIMGSLEHNPDQPRNVSEELLQRGWVTHLEAIAGDCNARRPPSKQRHPDPCPVDTGLLQWIEREQPSLGVPFMYTELPDCGGCGTGVWKRVKWCPATKDYCGPRNLDPNWHANLLALTKALKPLIDSGKIGAVALGDELVDHGVSFENFSSVATVLRQELGPKVKLLANDACSPPGPAGWATIPAALDYISCDVYNVTSGAGEADKIIEYYDRFLHKLHPHQQALLVPGTFSCSTGIGVTENRSSQTAMVLQKLEALSAYAATNPKIGGFYPWHLMDRMTMADSKRCDYRHGAVSMPPVMAKLREIGSSIVQSEQQRLQQEQRQQQQRQQQEQHEQRQQRQQEEERTLSESESAASAAAAAM